MFDLQDSLDERLDALKKKNKSIKSAKVMVRGARRSSSLNYVSKEEIKKSLAKAGIVNKSGEMTIIRVS